MAVIHGLAFPEGRLKALTLSYDDGVTADRRLVEIMNKNAIRGTFHLNAGLMGNEKNPNRLPPEQIASLYAGHEVSAHGYTHPFLEKLPDAAIIKEILDDRRELEKLTGYPIRGMSYPFGTYNDRVVEILKKLGITYARTTRPTHTFNISDDFLRWHPTCHHKHDLLEKTRDFLATDGYRLPALFYVWGHAYEFDNDNNWELIEEFCQTAGGRKDVWYATNQEIVDYLTAYRRLEFSVDCDMAFNPSAESIWVRAEEGIHELTAGKLTRIV